MRTRVVCAVAAVLVAWTLMGSTSGALVGGVADGGRNSNVAVIDIELNGGAAGYASCTGTLIAPRVVLTAGHCLTWTGGRVVTALDVSFAETPAYDDDEAPIGPRLFGIAYAVKPGWDPALLTVDHDLGVIVLDQPASAVFPGVTPAALPTEGHLDRYATGRKPDLVVSGYGYHEAPGGGKRTYDYLPIERRTGAARFQSLTADRSIINNRAPNSPNASVICSGDSGGPLFEGRTVVGVISSHTAPRLRAWAGTTSQGITNTATSWCEGTSFFPRLDTPSSRAFLANFVLLP